MATAVRAKDVKSHFKDLCARIINGETMIVSRPKNENIVMISESEYKKLEKARRNADFKAMIDRRFEAMERGEGKPHELIED